jgi:hypothetical protein
MGMSIFDSSKRFELFPKHGFAMKRSGSGNSTSGGKKAGLFSSRPKLSKLGGLYVSTRSDSSGG